MSKDSKHSEHFFIDSKPSKIKIELDDVDNSNHCKRKKRRHETDNTPKLSHTQDIKISSLNTGCIKNENDHSVSVIKASIVYYENVLKDLKKGVSSEIKGKT